MHSASTLDVYKVQGLRLLPVADNSYSASPIQRKASIANEACTQETDHAYDFGYNNPLFSDKILHVMRERPSCSTQMNQQLHSETPLLSMYVNSLTLAANSELFR